MEVCIKEDPVELGKAAGKVAADLIKKAIEKKRAGQYHFSYGD